MRDTAAIASAGIGLDSQGGLDFSLTRSGSRSDEWSLDPRLTFLNHGSYGATPRAALEAQGEIRARMERDPVRFFKVDLEHLMDEARGEIASLINCRPQDIAPMRNATAALNVVLANADLRPGDEVLITDHEYMSLVNELERFCPRMGVKLVKARVPFPIGSPDEAFDAIVSCVTPRTRLAFFAHITSATSLIFPVARLTKELESRGIDVCVDGAHGPGQIPVDVRALGCTYYVGSLHKWASGPKGSGFVCVRADRQVSPRQFRPLSLSSRAHKVRPERALFLRDFDYQGTDDYSAFLAAPAAIRALGRLMPGGWAALFRRNHELVLEGRRVVCEALGINPPAPGPMVGMMATIELPEPHPSLLDRPTLYDDPLQDVLVERHGIVVPVWRLAADNKRVLRLSAQHYNTLEDFRVLAGALSRELSAEMSPPRQATRASA